MKTYATYVRGMERWTGPIHGLLTLTDDALHFESAKVEVRIPRGEIRRITDLDGAVEAKTSWRARLANWLNVEPNGVRVEWGERTLIFDCEKPVAGLLNAT